MIPKTDLKLVFKNLKPVVFENRFAKKLVLTSLQLTDDNNSDEIRKFHWRWELR